MEKVILYGNYSATLRAGDYRAMLILTKEVQIPIMLADALNEEDGISAVEILRDDYGRWNIRMIHSLSACNLVEAVQNALTRECR